MHIGVAKYTFIMDTFWHVNACTNYTFKVVFSDFYKLNIGTDKYFLDNFFYYLEYGKSHELRFEDVLQILHKYSNKMHGSFSSKLIATIDPKLPIIDQFIRLHLELPTYRGINNASQIIQQYYEIIDIYRSFLQIDKVREWIRLFDSKFPNNKIENIKKIDFILWQIR